MAARLPDHQTVMSMDFYRHVVMQLQVKPRCEAYPVLPQGQLHELKSENYSAFMGAVFSFSQTAFGLSKFGRHRRG